MDLSRAAERALVSALVIGEADPTDLSGRLRPEDFTDPAAALLFEAALDTGRSGGLKAVADLPRVLRAQGALRRDGYPISPLLEWMPRLPAPAHPEAYGVFMGGTKLDSDDQNYLYCVVFGTGMYSIKHRFGGEVHTLVDRKASELVTALREIAVRDGFSARAGVTAALLARHGLQAFDRPIDMMPAMPWIMKSYPARWA